MTGPEAIERKQEAKRRSRALMLALFFLIAAPATNAQMDEYSIKAAYLYNFSKYVEWPAPAGAALPPTFAICIVGEDPFGGRIEHAVSGKTSGDGRLLEIRRLKGVDSAALRKCEMVFISASEKRNAAALRDSVKGSPVLTVADFSPFAEDGGIANLRIDGTKVRVDLNINAANQANLKVSGKLQQVANLVN
jgi:hypothetical protein